MPTMTTRRLAVELRAEVDGSRLVGHAAVFDQTVPYFDGFERIAPGAFDAVLAKKSTDVRALVNHDPHLVLGRQSAGTLRLSTDNRGLRFEVDLPDTSYANDLRELVARGDVTGASFGFVAGDERFEKARGGKQVRVHTSFAELLDVSPVTFPAFDRTAVALRSLDLTGPSAREATARIRARVKGISR